MDGFNGGSLYHIPSIPSSANRTRMFTSTPFSPGQPQFDHVTSPSVPHFSHIQGALTNSRANLQRDASTHSGYHGSVTRMTQVEIHPDYVELENELEIMKAQIDKLQQQGRQLSKPYIPQSPPVSSHEYIYPMATDSSFLNGPTGRRWEQSEIELDVKRQISTLNGEQGNKTIPSAVYNTAPDASQKPTQSGISLSRTAGLSHSYIALEHEVKTLKDQMDKLSKNLDKPHNSSYVPISENPMDSWLRYLETRNSRTESFSDSIQRRPTDNRPNIDTKSNHGLNQMKQQITKMKEEQENEMVMLESIKLNKDKLLGELDVCTTYMKKAQGMLDKCDDELHLLHHHEDGLKTGTEQTHDVRNIMEQRHQELIRRTSSLIDTIELLKTSISQEQKITVRETKEKMYTDRMGVVVSAKKRLAEVSPSSSATSSSEEGEEKKPQQMIAAQTSYKGDLKTRQTESNENESNPSLHSTASSLNKSAQDLISELGLNKTQSDLLLSWIRSERLCQVDSTIELTEDRTESDLLLKWAKDKENSSHSLGVSKQEITKTETLDNVDRQESLNATSTVNVEREEISKDQDEEEAQQEIVKEAERKESSMIDEPQEVEWTSEVAYTNDTPETVEMTKRSDISQEMDINDIMTNKVESGISLDYRKKEQESYDGTWKEKAHQKPLPSESEMVQSSTEPSDSRPLLLKLLQDMQKQSEDVMQSLHEISSLRSEAESRGISLTDIDIHSGRSSHEERPETPRDMIVRSLDKVKQTTMRVRDSFEEIKTSSVILVQSLKGVHILMDEKQKTKMLLEDLEEILANPPRLPTLKEQEENVNFECFSLTKWFRRHYPHKPEMKTHGVQYQENETEEDREISLSSLRVEMETPVQKFNLMKWLRKLYPHKPVIQTTIGLQCNVHDSDEDCVFHKECRVHRLHRVHSPMALPRSEWEAGTSGITKDRSTSSI